MLEPSIDQRKSFVTTSNRHTLQISALKPHVVTLILGGGLELYRVAICYAFVENCDLCYTFVENYILLTVLLKTTFWQVIHFAATAKRL